MNTRNTLAICFDCLEDRMAMFIMLVGLPGSGKSTYAEKMRENGFHIHSSDSIREELTGDATSQDKNTDVFNELHKRIKDDLKNGISCVYDATNISMKRRKSFLEELEKYDCKKICILFVVPVEICKKRNEERERKVPDSVFDKMLKQFQCPYYYEGWDKINIKWFQGEVEPIEFDWGMKQDNSHHTLSLGEHMKSSMEYAMKNDNNNYALTIAALFHDIGKFYTKTFIDSKGNNSKEAHYYGHENYGSYMFLVGQNIEILGVDCSSSKTDWKVQKNILYIASLINWHMKPMTAWKQSKRCLDRDRKMIGEEMYRDIMLLHEADLAAH